MERPHSIPTKRKSLIIDLTVKELGVLLLLIFLNFKFIGITVLQNRSIIVDICVYLLLLLTFNYSRWTYKSLFYTSISVSIYTLINFSPFKMNVLMPLLIMQCASSIKFRKYLLLNFIVTLFTLIMFYLLYGQGVNLGGYAYMIDRKTRMTFGFNHPNVAALYYYCLFINGLLLVYYNNRLRKYTILYLLLIIPIWVFIYIKTVSRSYLLSIFVLYFTIFYYLFGLFVKNKNILKYSKYPFIFLMILYTSITIFFSLNRDKYVVLDKIFSKRLTYYDRLFHRIDKFDFLFGSSSYNELVIDSSYVHLLFEGGIFFFFFFCFFYIISAINMVKEKVIIPICVTVSFLTYGLMETNLLYSMLIGTNIFWVTLFHYYQKNNELNT